MARVNRWLQSCLRRSINPARVSCFGYIASGSLFVCLLLDKKKGRQIFARYFRRREVCLFVCYSSQVVFFSFRRFVCPFLCLLLCLCKDRVFVYSLVLIISPTGVRLYVCLLLCQDRIVCLLTGVLLFVCLFRSRSWYLPDDYLFVCLFQSCFWLISPPWVYLFVCLLRVISCWEFVCLILCSSGILLFIVNRSWFTCLFQITSSIYFADSRLYFCLFVPKSPLLHQWVLFVCFFYLRRFELFVCSRVTSSI